MAFSTPLSKNLREALGADAGDNLVTWLQEMRAEHEETLASIRNEMQAAELRLAERIYRVEVNLGECISKVEVRLAEVKADLMKWSFLFWVGAVGAIAALAGVLRN